LPGYHEGRLACKAPTADDLFVGTNIDDLERP